MSRSVDSNPLTSSHIASLVTRRTVTILVQSPLKHVFPCLFLCDFPCMLVSYHHNTLQPVTNHLNADVSSFFRYVISYQQYSIRSITQYIQIYDCVFLSLSALFFPCTS